MGRLYHNGQPVVNINHGVADSSDATAIASDILATKTAYINNQKATGTMPNNGAVSQALNAGESYTIPQGYHNGSGEVTANSLASQTQGTATASDIATGLTAWVNGIKLTGTKEDATATITVTYDSSFYNKTMTCTNGTKTYTKTTTSSGSTTFNVNEEGTWTITCNGVSRTVNVVLSYSTQMAITKTVTIYGAKEDYITYTDATGSKVCQFASGATSKSVSITFIPTSATITFTSTVAKNPNNLSQNYSKIITLTDNITDIYVMPENAIYWYGYKSGLVLSDLSSRMTYSWRRGSLNADINLAENTNNLAYSIWQPYYTETSAQRNHVSQEELTGTIDLSSFNHLKAIATLTGSTASREIVTSGPYTTYPTISWTTTPATIAYDDSIENGLFDTDISSISSGVVGFMQYTLGTSSTRAILTLSAVWLE